MSNHGQQKPTRASSPVGSLDHVCVPVSPRCREYSSSANNQSTPGPTTFNDMSTRFLLLFQEAEQNGISVPILSRLSIPGHNWAIIGERSYHDCRKCANASILRELVHSGELVFMRQEYEARLELCQMDLDGSREAQANTTVQLSKALVRLDEAKARLAQTEARLDKTRNQLEIARTELVIARGRLCRAKAAAEDLSCGKKRAWQRHPTSNTKVDRSGSTGSTRATTTTTAAQAMRCGLRFWNPLSLKRLLQNRSAKQTNPFP